MRHVVSVLIGASLFFSSASSSAVAATEQGESKSAHARPTGDSKGIGTETERRIDAVFADVPSRGAPGYAFGIAHDGRLIYAKGFGEANLDDAIPITPTTAFHLASLSKQFTGAAIALLVLDGKLSLEDPVGKYIPEATKYGPALKIKHLVYMTSGIWEYTSQPRASGQPWFTDFYFTRDEAIAAALAKPELEFVPGQKWKYSNSNYMLLTKVVETVSGQSFADFMRVRVFQPLHMGDTHVDDDTTLVVPHRATGYAKRGAELTAAGAELGITIRPGSGYARMLRVSPHFGGSGVFSSLEDLARWNANFDEPRLGGAAFTRLMHKRERFANSKDDDAFGLVSGAYEGRPVWWYSGGDADASTYMTRFTQTGLTIICLSNIKDGDCEGRTRKVLAVMATDKLLPEAALPAK